MSLFSKKQDRVIRNSRLLIGITQTQAGVGATHFCLAFSNYLSHVKNKKTAVISANFSHAFACLEQRCIGSKSSAFSLQGIDFYNGCSQTEWTKIYFKDYDILLIDFGVFHNEAEVFFSSCNIRFLIGSLQEWREAAYSCLMEQPFFFEQQSAYTFLALFATKEQQKRFRQKYGVRIQSIPYEPDPFLLRRDNLAFYDSLTHGAMFLC